MNKYFTKEEFACKCCGLVKIDEQLVALAYVARVAIAKPLVITSAYRCPKHNKNVGGAEYSLHVAGQAIDISIATLSNQERLTLLNIAIACGGTGVGINFEKKFIHLSISPKKEGLFKY